MGQDISGFTKTVIAPLVLATLRENTKMAALVNRDYDGEAKKKNAVISVQLPPDMGVAGDFTTGGGSSKDIENVSADITLAKWKYKQFELSDKDMAEAENGLVPSVLEAAVKSIANAIDLDLLNLYKDIPYYYGTAATTPDEDADIVGVRKELQKNLAPPGDRRLMLDIEAEAKMLILFKDAAKAGTTMALRKAELGEMYGFDTFIDQLIPLHTASDIDGTPAVDGTVAEGAQTLIIDSITTDGKHVYQGDHFTVADTPGTYTVLTGGVVASNEVEITFYPAAPAETFVSAKVITMETTNWTPNLAFQKNAFTLAMRTLKDPGIQANNVNVMSIVDPISGVPIRLMQWYDPNTTLAYWKLDVLYGVKTLRPELAAILYG